MLGNRVAGQFVRLSSRMFLENTSARFQTTASQQAENQASSLPDYKTLALSTPKPFVIHVELNRPDKLNAISHQMWYEIKDCFDKLEERDDCRVVLLSARGRAFTSGLDFSSMMVIGEKLAEHEDVARKCKVLRPLIRMYQESMTSLEKCCKPVISLVQGLCIGAGVDMITAADIRYCTEDAKFCVKEIDIGMAADVGTLQRLPKVIGSRSLSNELVFTGRMMEASEAKDCGLVNRLYKDKDSMVASALEIAEDIASKSPVAVQVAKRNMIFSRDHSVQEGLDHIADMNMTMLQSEDFMNASVAQATKGSKPVFAKL